MKVFKRVWEKCISKGLNRKVRTVRNPSKRPVERKIEEVDADADKPPEIIKEHIYERPKTRTQTKRNTICQQIPVVKKRYRRQWVDHIGTVVCLVVAKTTNIMYRSRG